MIKKKILIISTDPGTEDAVAFAYVYGEMLLAEKEGRNKPFDAIKIITGSGNVSPEQTAKNACRTLEFIGQADAEVWTSPGGPKSRIFKTDNFFGSDGLNGIDILKEPKIIKLQESKAEDELICLLDNNENEVTLLCLAPLTDIMIAEDKKPNILKNIHRVVMMSCCFDDNNPRKQFGNVTPYAEFNSWADAPAMKAFFEVCYKYKIPVTILPMELGDTIKAREKEVKKINSINNKASKMFSMILEANQEHYPDGTIAPLSLYDSAAAVYLIHPEVFTKSYQVEKVEIIDDKDSKNEKTGYRGIKDGHSIAINKGQGHCKIVCEVNVSAFFEVIYKSFGAFNN